MYRLHENRMWAGVCSGLGAYFGVDAVWVRVLFVLLTIFTGGVWILIYIAMCFIVPMAETAEERAAAYGAPFNANELINRVKKNSSEFRYRGPRMSRGPRMGRGSSWWAPHAGNSAASACRASARTGLRSAGHRRNPAAGDDRAVCSLVCRHCWWPALPSGTCTWPGVMANGHTDITAGLRARRIGWPSWR